MASPQSRPSSPSCEARGRCPFGQLRGKSRCPEAGLRSWGVGREGSPPPTPNWETNPLPRKHKGLTVPLRVLPGLLSLILWRWALSPLGGTGVKQLAWALPGLSLCARGTCRSFTRQSPTAGTRA